MRCGAGLLYATSGDGTTYGLRAATGAPVWSRRVGAGEGRAYGRANVLGLDGDTLYVGGTDRTVYALDASTGSVRWTYGAQVTLASPPAAAAGLVFVGTAEGKVRALAAPAGATR
jgi:serine/threonine-protein kinase